MIQSVDSFETAQQISRRSGEQGITTDILLESTSVRMKTNSDIPQTKLRISSEKYRNSGLSKSKV